MTTHAEAKANPDAFTVSYRRTLDAQATYSQAFKMATLASGSDLINADALGFLLEINLNTIAHGERTVRLATGMARKHAERRLQTAVERGAGLRAEIERLSAED